MSRRFLVAAALATLIPCAPATAANVVSGTCDFSVSGLPTSRNVLVSIQATATANGGPDVQYTTVRCAVSNSYGEAVVAEIRVPGSHVAIVAEGIIQASSLSRCLTADAKWILSQEIATYSDC